MNTASWWRAIQNSRQVRVDYCTGFRLEKTNVFSTDAGFGLVKRLYHRENIYTTDEMIDLINRSSKTNVGVHWKNLEWHSWRLFLSQFLKKKLVDEIASHFNFVFRLDENGAPIIETRQYSNSENVSVFKAESLFESGASIDDFPELSRFKPLSEFRVEPKRLDRSRAKYLHDNYKKYYTDTKLPAFIPEWFEWAVNDERLKTEYHTRFVELTKADAGTLKKIAQKQGIKVQTSDSKYDHILAILVNEEEIQNMTEEERQVRSSLEIEKVWNRKSLKELKEKVAELGLHIETATTVQGQRKAPKKIELVKAIVSALVEHENNNCDVAVPVVPLHATVEMSDIAIESMGEMELQREWGKKSKQELKEKIVELGIQLQSVKASKKSEMVEAIVSFILAHPDHDSAQSNADCEQSLTLVCNQSVSADVPVDLNGLYANKSKQELKQKVAEMDIKIETGMTKNGKKKAPTKSQMVEAIVSALQIEPDNNNDTATA